MDNKPTVTRRHLPHWEVKGSTYFITFKTSKTKLSVKEVELVLNHIKAGNAKYYNLIAAVVLTDHVHCVISPLGKYSLSRLMKGIKGVSARIINDNRGTDGTIWQAESFDRIIRDRGDFEIKLNYMWHNPVKSGLSQSPQEYPGWYFNSEFENYVDK